MRDRAKAITLELRVSNTVTPEDLEVLPDIQIIYDLYARNAHQSVQYSQCRPYRVSGSTPNDDISKMSTPTAYHQIGKFIVLFQDVEAAINEILVLLVNVDSEAVLILINGLECSQRLKTADVLFGRFVDLNGDSELSAKAEFHELIVKLMRLGERRNVLVHSKYMPWINIEGLAGLIRKNSNFVKVFENWRKKSFCLKHSMMTFMHSLLHLKRSKHSVYV
jgi:hypothetical protein